MGQGRQDDIRAAVTNKSVKRRFVKKGESWVAYIGLSQGLEKEAHGGDQLLQHEVGRAVEAEDANAW